MDATVLEPPAVLSVSKTRTRTGPPKSRIAGFEELSAVDSWRVFLRCTRGIDGGRCHGSGTGGRFECVGKPRPRQAGQVRGLMREYLRTGSFLISASKCMPMLRCLSWRADSTMVHLFPPNVDLSSYATAPLGNCSCDTTKPMMVHPMIVYHILHPEALHSS